ncbi:MAG: ATP-binding protein [Bacteroidetes bacterium]|nr:ATP-binding protein [Bacteroidota bacterium]
MRNLILTLLALVIFQLTHAQKVGRPLIDSLIAELPGMKEDTDKVKILTTVCYELRNINPREALNPGLDALQLAEKINFQYGQGLAHYSLTFIYHILSRLPESIDHALKAEAIFESLKENNHLCATYLMLAYLYKDLDKGITAEYMRKATALLPYNRDILWKARNYGTLGNNYRNLDQFDSAGKYMQIHLQMSKENHLGGEIMIVNNRFGYMYMAQSRVDTAYALIRTGLEYFQAIGSTRMVAENSTTLGRIRLRQSQDAGSLRNQYLREAEVFALEGLKVSCELGYLIQSYTANRLLSDIYKAKGRNDMALGYLNAAFIDYDSVYGAQIVSKASVLSWKNEEELKEKQVELLKLHNRQQMVIIFGAIFGIIILVIAVFVIINSRRRQRKAYLLVQEQKEEITRVLGELESTNQELEAFSYSVSHDLRAPVRRIESLCMFLRDDYEILLDVTGKDLLKHITESTGLMNRLIEDLLTLSRITRQTVTRAPCHLSDMAAKICEDLKLTYPGKTYTCRIEENIIVQADFRLLHIALQNLIDNAWKYSSKVENPEIIIGSELTENRKFIFIRDNGVGFDMGQAGKLFTPFQRLHTDEHFKGSGIGLATVKRIIVKHGGTISAQSEPGKGTIFSFTLTGN